MPSTTAEQKKQLRKSVRSLLTALSPEERTAGDRAMFQAFLSLPEVRQTGTFFLFWGIAGLEPDTGSLAASLTKLGKTVCLPRVVPGFGMECRSTAGAAHGHLRLRHPGAHGAGPSNPP